MTQTMPPADEPLETREEKPRMGVSHAPGAVDSLKQAMRRARSDEAERSGARAELRNTRLARLEMLQDALAPLVAQIPDDIDLFDVALKPGSDPRLFIDMIGWVEMGRDARLYRMIQDTRHGRVEIAENEDIGEMVDVVTDYVARRLLERDRALASDAQARRRAEVDKWTRSDKGVTSPVPPARPARAPVERRDDTPPVTRPTTRVEEEPAPAAARSRRAPVRWGMIAFAFLIDLLGSVAFFTIVAAIGWYLWNRMHTPI